MNTNLEGRIKSLEIRNTADGSPTLFVPELNEHYHSVHGALQESRHVFIEAGLKPVLQNSSKPAMVFEVGFGTGLNAILTYSEALKANVPVHYDTIEAFPLPETLVAGLQIKEIVTDEQAQIFTQMHAADWDKKVQLHELFSIYKLNSNLQEANLPASAYNVIYFDAFAPEKQPELWEENIFCKMHRLLQPDGLLVTYCAKGIVKRRLRAAGFEVEAIAGPPGKREMIRAICKK